MYLMRFARTNQLVASIKVRRLIIPTCSSSSLSSSTSKNSAPPVMAMERDDAVTAMSLAIRGHRRSIFSRMNAACSNLIALANYRLFYDKTFRLRVFREKATFAVYLIAEKLVAKDFARLKDLVAPSALSALKKTIKEDKGTRNLLTTLKPGIAPVLRQKLFTAAFSYANGYGQGKTSFEITFLYFCRMEPRLFNRKKQTIIAKPNQRTGGYDTVPGTIPDDAIVYTAVWITFTRSLDTKVDNDWTVSYYEASPSFVREKTLRE